MPFKNTNIRLEKIGRQRYVLLDDLVYEGQTDTWTVPAGFETDFATVPSFISALIPSDSDGTLAAILHDWFCVQLARQYNSGGTHKSPISSRDADAVFRRVLRELGVKPPRRWTMWTGVRWGALAGKCRRQGFIYDLPLVLLISIIVAPVVVPISLLTMLGLLIDRALGTVLGWFGWH